MCILLDMELCYISVLLSLVVTANSITVYPGQNYTEGRCSGPVDYFFCNCLTSNSTIDIHLSPGHYKFRKQPLCVLSNKTSVRIIGSGSDNTIIECMEPFSMVLMSLQNVVISNIQMRQCGDVVNNLINETI